MKTFRYSFRCSKFSVAKNISSPEVSRFWMDSRNSYSVKHWTDPLKSSTCNFEQHHITGLAENSCALQQSHVRNTLLSISSSKFMLLFLHFTQKSVIKWLSKCIESNKLALGIKMKHEVPIIINSAKALQHFYCTHMCLLVVGLSHIIILLEFRWHDNDSLLRSS